MTKYKLTYFDIPGIAEPIRYLLSILGDFEDCRTKQEEWPTVKPNTPFGKLPVLEVDGKKATQSNDICRYLGRKAKLAGNNEWEDLQIDSVVDTYNDLRQAISGYYFEKNEDEKQKKLDTLLKETLPFYLGKLDEIAKKNNGYLANGKLSWGDVYFTAHSNSIKSMTGHDFVENYESLKRVKDHVLALPGVKKWIESRG